MTAELLYQFKLDGVEWPPNYGPTQTFPASGDTVVYVRPLHLFEGEYFYGPWAGPITATVDDPPPDPEVDPPTTQPAGFAGLINQTVSFDLRPFASSTVALTFEKVADPSIGGTLTIGTNGIGTYAPPTGAVGVLSGATWKVTDTEANESTATAMAFVLQNSIRAATFQGEQDQSVSFSLAPYVSTSLLLTFEKVTGPTAGGTLAIAANGTGIYTPPAGESGSLTGATWRGQYADSAYTNVAALNFYLDPVVVIPDPEPGVTPVQIAVEDVPETAVDVAILWQDWSADLAIHGGDLKRENTLKTAVIHSLFTNRLANTDDTLPDGGSDRRGWWGDTLDEDGYNIGSRLWLLDREKTLPAIEADAEYYVREALQPMLDEGSAKSVDVTATVSSTRGSLDLAVGLEKPSGETVEFRFVGLWQAME